MTRFVVDVPTPVLAITARASAATAGATVADADAALREAAQRLGATVVGDAVRVDHGDARVVEVCLPIDRLPEAEPPPPIAAEVLTPGTTVEVVASG